MTSASYYKESIDRYSPIPLYIQIANDMTQRIAEEEWRIGDQLMTESMLIELYDASRVTMRQALACLENSGLITRKRGSRAIVIARPKYMVQELHFPGKENHSPVINPAELITSANIVISEAQSPHRWASRMLALQEEAPLIYLERNFENNGQVVGVNRAWFPKALFPDLIERGLVEGSISTTLRNIYHYDTSSVDNYIAAITLNAYFARILDVPYGSPALRIDSVHFSNENSPFEFSSTIWNGNNAQFHLVVSK